MRKLSGITFHLKKNLNEMTCRFFTFRIKETVTTISTREFTFALYLISTLCQQRVNKGFNIS